MNIEQKALAACIEMVAAVNEVKRLKNLIGDSLNLCHAEYVKAGGNDFFGWTPHLERAYAFEELEETQYNEGGRDYLSEEDQQAVLSECPHCMAAHNAIQDRKKARIRVGNAKRAITRIGKA